MDIQTEVGNYLRERARLVDAIRREGLAGTPAVEIARGVPTAAFSRDQVKEFIACVLLADTAAKAFAQAGLAGVLTARESGIDAPRHVTATLTVDPQQLRDRPEVARQARDALRDYLLTLELPLGQPDPGPGEREDLIDRLLLDGAAVRLVKLKPRT
ncbi:hypothetical protein ACIGO9_30190 [Nocardia asteroides]|uniref:hypothetical protein n=1 Tax=Nocardia asteroides TaxID=1824 RepID=UPI0037C61773